MITKVLDSAVSNAKQKGLSEDQLFISRIQAEQGPSWKRFRSAAFGRATAIQKKTTHLTIELDLVSATFQFSDPTMKRNMHALNFAQIVGNGAAVEPFQLPHREGKVLSD